MSCGALLLDDPPVCTTPAYMFASVISSVSSRFTHGTGSPTWLWLHGAIGLM